MKPEKMLYIQFDTSHFSRLCREGGAPKWQDGTTFHVPNWTHPLGTHPPAVRDMYLTAHAKFQKGPTYFMTTCIILVPKLMFKFIWRCISITLSRFQMDYWEFGNTKTNIFFLRLIYKFLTGDVTFRAAKIFVFFFRKTVFKMEFFDKNTVT